MRKNIHMPDELGRAIGNIRHEAKFQSETAAIVSLLEGAIGEVTNNFQYVYLAHNVDTGLLKIGYSANPLRRIKDLTYSTKQDVQPVAFLHGSRLLELISHTLWAKHRLMGEWFEDKEVIRDWFNSHDLAVDDPEVATANIGKSRAESLKQKIDFTAEQLDQINWEADVNRRAFKHEVATLVDEALAARAKVMARKASQ